MSVTATPAAPSLLPGEDTGSSNSDGVTALNGPMLVGQTVPYAVITLYDNAVMAGAANATADANGFYSIYPYPVLDDGKHTLTITATAPGATPSLYSPPLYLVVDTSAPDAPTAPVLAAGSDTGISAEDGITDKNVLQLTGTTEPGAIVALYNGTDANDDGKDDNSGHILVSLQTVTAGADGSYSFATSPLADGTYAFTVKATDLAGNVSKRSASTSITVDTAAPAVPAAPTLSPGSDTGVSHSDGLTNDATPVVVGTAEANSTVLLYDDGQEIAKAQANASGNYAITAPTLDDGAHTLTVAAQDVAGNTSAASAALNVAVDTAPATATITPAATIEEAGSVTFAVDFSTAVAKLTTGDFKLVTTGSANGSVQSVSGSGGVYAVTVNGLSGEGTVGLAFAGTAVTDLAGNAVSVTQSDNQAVSGTTTPSTVVVSASASGVVGTGVDGSPSASGRIVAFNSIDGNLVPSGAVDGTNNVFVKDTQTGAIILVSEGTDDQPANGDSFGASLSADGTKVAFASEATNLVDGGTEPGETNIYVATLTEGAGGPALTDVELVSDGNGVQGEGVGGEGNQATSTPILSGDGSTVVFDSTQPLVAGAESGIENVYAENVASGVITLVSGGTGTDEYAYGTYTDPIIGMDFTVLLPQPDRMPGTGGDLDSDVTSVSANGQLIGYESYATDLGGPPVDITDQLTSPSRGYVYNTVTGTTTALDGTTVLNPSAEADTNAIQTYAPTLSGDGSTVYFEVHYVVGNSFQEQELYAENLATGVITPVAVSDPADNNEVYVSAQSSSKGGGLVLYQNNPGYFSDQAAYQIVLDNPVSGTTTQEVGGYQPVLTTAANAFTFVEEPNGALSDELYETNFGVSAGIDAVGTDDALGVSALAHAAASGGLAISGTTNAPAGATVLVQLFGASASTNALNSAVVTGTADGAGHWSATVPVAFLQQTGDGPYALVVQIGTTAGASFFSVRDFTVDTQVPATPDAPKLDAGSDTSTAGDGSATNQDSPVITGSAEAGATVTLYDTSSATPDTAIGSAVADGDGVYVITATPLINGKHTLDVTATDAAGNVSAASDGLTITVDTIVPDTPNTPELQPASPDGSFTGTSLDGDTTPPVAASDTGLSDTDGITSNATPVLVGQAEPGTTVTLYDTDGVAMLGTATVAANGKYAITSSSLSDGTHKLTVTDTDAAGNVSHASAPLAVTIDTLPPLQPTIASVTGALVSGDITPLVTVNGTAEPGSTVKLVLDGGMTAASIFGESTAASDGDYSINSDYLPAGDGQNLSVTATDFAGNTSQASLPVDVNVAASNTPPPGVPPFTPTLLGLLTDGPIFGASVFADTNGNGVRDANEGTAITGADGTFQLANTGGELVARGGTDTQTGLTPPGVLTAPAGSVVIDPLTTLLDAYAAVVGETPQVAQPALLAVLGLDPTADVTQLDPEATASGGDSRFLITSAQIMDSAVVYAELVAAQTGVSTATAFAASFTALAQQAATGTLNLQDTSTTLVNLATAAAGIADPGFVLANGLAKDAATILDSGNYDLTTARSQTDPSSALTLVEAIERVEQGQAAPQLAAASNDQAAADQVGGTYSYGLPGAVTAAKTPVLAPPVLAALDDTGISAQDDLTSDTTPTFTGTAPPGATVVLAVQVLNEPGTYSIVGSATADPGGGYAVATTLPAGQDEVVAFEATPGEATALGTQFYLSADLTSAQLTQVTVGDLPEESGAAAPPRFLEVDYTASSANDATATSLYVTGTGSYDIQEGALYTVTANGNSVTETAAQGNGDAFGILTTPLAAGTYSLVVTETALDGETVQSAPTIVTVTAPGSLNVQTEAAGPVAGGSILPYEPELSANQPPSPDIHPNATTDASGAASIPAQSIVPVQGSSLVYETDAGGLQVQGGQDALTGLVLPVPLSAPPGASVITPATSLLNQADTDATPPEYVVTATDYAYENSRIDTALGLSTTVDLATADPLAMAEAGDPALFLKDVELLDTTFLLVPFTEDGDAAYTADPLYVIDKSLGSNIRFDGFIGGKAPAITTVPIDFTSAAEVLSWLTTYDSTVINGSYDTHYDPSVLPTVATIIAASNAAIEAHAAASSSPADTISYALAVERVALSGEQQALAALASTYSLSVSVPQQQAGFAALQTDYTGPGLQAAVAAVLAQTVQVTGFTPASASTGAAQEVFTIAFSTPVSGVTAGDFTVSGGAGLVGDAVTAVTPIAGSDGAAYAVTVATGVGEGTLTLGFTPNGLTNADGSPLTTGTFGAPQTYSTLLGVYGEEPLPQSLATGDFNGDGHTDVVIANGSADGLTLFLGQGNGSFVAEPAIYTGSNGPGGASQVVTGDFNGDGKLDAVLLNHRYTTNGQSGVGDLTVSAMLGNGDGTFAGPVQTDVGPSAGDIVAGDFNGDGKLDLAVLDSSGYGGDGAVQLFYGNGDGTFRAGPTMDVGAPLDLSLANADQMAAVDLTGDGKADLVIATSSATTGTPGVSILLGNGQGGFTQAAPPALGLGVSNGDLIAVADLNGDGIPDIVAVPQETEGNETAVVLLGHGDGTFQPALSVPLALPPGGSVSGNTINGNDQNVAITIGDVTGDGKPDIVVENNESGVVVAPGNGDGTFGSSNTDVAAVNNGAFGVMTLADVNSDGRLDLIATEHGGSEAASSVTSGISVSLGTAQTVLPATASVTVDRPAVAQPTLTKSSGAGALTSVGNAYTLDLGTLSQGAAASVALALANAAAAPADSFDGLFSTPSGSGFTFTGADLAQAVAAGGSYTGLSFAADTSTPGSYSETLTFAPRDVTAVATPTTATADPETGLIVTDPAQTTDAVAEELSPITLTVNDTVLASGTTIAPAALAPVAAVTLPDARMGATDAAAITITNTAVDPAASLDVTATASGAAIFTGNITGLTSGGTDTTDLVAGLNTSTAGALSGTITLAPVSDADGITTPLASVQVPVSGNVFRSATAQIAPVSTTVHVGDPGTVTLPVGNSDPADGFSESLIAAISSVTAGLTVAAGGPTADIAPGGTDRSLAVGVSTATAAIVSGTATLSLTSDGGTGASGVDGLGKMALAAGAVPITVTVDNYAQAKLAAAGATLIGTAASGYTLDLGAVQEGSAPVSVTIDTVNSATGPADSLAGSYTVTAGQGLSDSGFAAFSGDGAGQADAGGTITLQTGQAGTFSQIIKLKSTGSNASGYSGALADQTVTVDGTVVAASMPTGNVTTTPASVMVAEGAPATPIGITAPTDPAYNAAQLTITAASLPADGTVLLSDGVTPVTAGEVLTGAQLTGLLFQPAAGQFDQTSAFTYTVTDPSGNASAGTAQLTIGAALGNPVTTPGTLTVTPGQGATALGIQAPTDPNYAAAALDATVTALPADGSIDLADGTTPIALGQVLSATQLTSLTFLPANGASSTQSSFGYVVADPAGNASTGSLTLAVGAGTSSTGSGTATPPAAPVLTPGNLLSDFATPAVGGTAAAGSTVTLLSNGTPVATAMANATGAFTAVPTSALPLGPDALTATATTAGGVSAASLPVDLFETPTQVSGVSLPDASTRDVITALGQNFGLELTGDTQEVQLLDGTISVAPGTNEGFLARLYEGLFGRSPDPATGYADDQFAMGLTHAQVATEFLASPESQADFAGLSNSAFVSTIAQGLLGRSLSAADQSAFASLLNSGASRGVVLEGIADSAESQTYLSTATSDVFIPRPTSAAVYELYETSLGRDGDLAGVQFASNEVLQSGLTLLQVAQQIAMTPEFVTDHASQSNASYVNSLYQDGLGRSADAASALLTSALNAGQITRANALFAVASSPEAAAYLTRSVTTMTG